ASESDRRLAAPASGQGDVARDHPLALALDEHDRVTRHAQLGPMKPELFSPRTLALRRFRVLAFVRDPHARDSRRERGERNPAPERDQERDHPPSPAGRLIAQPSYLTSALVRAPNRAR